VLVEEALSVEREQGKGCAYAEVYLSGEDAGGKEDVVAVTKGPKDIDAALESQLHLL